MTALVMAAVALAQAPAPAVTPPPASVVTQPVVTPPAAADQPNAANPNQRVHFQRPDMPAADDVKIFAETQDNEGSMHHYRGHVVIDTIDRKLEADEVDYDQDTGEVEARGHVRFENYLEGDKLECDHGKYNYFDETGIFWDVRGTSPAKIMARPGLLTTNNPFYFEGKWAERKSDHYILHDGFVTDCKIPKPWWRFTAPKFDIVPNERAIGYHAVFHLKRLPLFYFPAFYKSLKRLPRKSGFLTPSFGRSTLYGEFFGLGYYWAINRSYDLRYEGVYYSLRGLASTLDLRGKITPGTDFGFHLYGVNDRGVDIGNGVIQKQGGYQFLFDSRSELGDGWEYRGQINYLSSFLFRQSFSQSFHDAIYSESRSDLFVTKHWDSYAFTVVAERDEDFEDVLPADKIIIRKLPEVNFLSRDRQLVDGPIPLWFSMESSAGFLDRTQPDFQTRQFVSRLDINPEISTSFHWGGFSLQPSFGIRETDYGSSILNGVLSGQNILRSAREVNVTLIPPSLERIFKSPKWLGGEKLKHVIEPRVEYSFVDGINNFNRIIRFDENDLLTNTNQVTLSIANRFFVKDKDGNVNEVLSWVVSQARYFDPTFGGAVIPGQRNVIASSIDLDGFAFLDGPRNYSPVVSALRFQHVVGFEWRVDYDPLLKHISNSSLSADWRFSNYLISVGDNQVRTDPAVSPASDQLRGTFGIGNGNRKGWNGAFSEYYDYKNHVLLYSLAQVTYNTDCCGISLEYRRFNIGTRDDTQYKVAFAISNVGTFGNLKKQERIF
jgi:LPS-assembly protein